MSGDFLIPSSASYTAVSTLVCSLVLLSFTGYIKSYYNKKSQIKNALTLDFDFCRMYVDELF